MFENASAEILEILNKDNMTANSHHFCVSLGDFAKFNLTNKMRLLSTSTDSMGETFVSSVEGTASQSIHGKTMIYCIILLR